MNLAAIVLAAGAATRFGGGKLAAQFQGEPLLNHAIRAAHAAPVRRVIVVTGSGLDTGEWDDGPIVEVVRLKSGALSESLKAGIAAAGDADGAFVFLGDMPLVPHDMAARLVPLLADTYAAVPRHQGTPGHPVLLSRRAFADIATLDGDEGAGRLLKRRSDVAWLDIADCAILIDIDRREDLARLERGIERGED